MPEPQYGEPWRWTETDLKAVDSKGAALWDEYDFYLSAAMERRIVACVNFCRHLTDEQLVTPAEPRHCETCKFWGSPYKAGNGNTYGYCSGLNEMVMGHDPVEDILTEPTFGCLRHCPREEPIQ